MKATTIPKKKAYRQLIANDVINDAIPKEHTVPAIPNTLTVPTTGYRKGGFVISVRYNSAQDPSAKDEIP